MGFAVVQQKKPFNVKPLTVSNARLESYLEVGKPGKPRAAAAATSCCCCWLVGVDAEPPKCWRKGKAESKRLISFDCCFYSIVFAFNL